MAAKQKTKGEIIDQIAKDADLTKVQAKAALESLVAQVAKNAKAGFTIPGVGKVTTTVRKARDGRNPITGEKIDPSCRILPNTQVRSTPRILPRYLKMFPVSFLVI